ncbi:NAD(P)/FAD-dependent oxidoreductase [Pontibacter sp. E15-1]|uniref:NAD(P)/FAD-dependent oxidoreductase n=1 Tax=Pontibacter sp. E15-1 TaxID=2919918 RepID=UPI001F503191|nr:NAD(P)/FAD-dependent oxidoreductase [Pontibacter sp. E15-1]MCJ8167047.1 NAD(P)/FAD-dependent oxidoreductase [Pontibacter sp. E15-1]
MEYEIIIVGGGPAGMSAALVLGRSRIKTLLLNTENPRNMVTTYSHGFLTQDGKHPREIFRIAKQQLTKYPSVNYKKEKAIDVKSENGSFSVSTENNTYSAKRVIIATGHKDNISSIGIEGLTEVYGKSVYPCPFCDGFEMADKKLAVISDANMAPMFSKTISHWSKDVIVFTNGEHISDKGMVLNLQKNGVSIVEKKIHKLISKGGILTGIELEDGSIIDREGGFLPDTNSTESTDFAKRMNVPTEIGLFGMTYYKVDENKETDIKGIYIVGDARTRWSGVASSVAEGSEVAEAITHQIIEEKWK